jgi:acyl-CoA thioester hydrolase
MSPHPHRPPEAADPRDLPGSFSHEVVIEVRFADTDGMRHVNNATYLTYCEIARLRYWTDVTGERFSEGNDGAESLILAEARITYRDQTQYGETVAVQSRATRIGTSSFTLQHRLTAGFPGDPRRLVAVSESVLVRFDYATERPVALTPDLIEALETFEGRTLRGPSGG